MHPILSTPAFPQSYFMAVAVVTGGLDRATVENWIRGGSLVPASASGGEAFGKNFSGPTFSVANLIKLLMIADFRAAFGVPPRKGAALADEVIQAYEDEILQVLQANQDGSALPGPVIHKVGRFQIALPINWWAARAAGVLESWAATSAGDAPVLKQAVEAWREECQQ